MASQAGPEALRKDASPSNKQSGKTTKTLKTALLEPADQLILILSTVFKVLLFPAYHSTDFEVHRNWLAITHTLPIKDWYFEATSQWTLDYPPFFAYFSFILAQPAPFFDPLIVALHEGLEHAATPAKYYMRATVVVTEFVLAAALLALSKKSDDGHEAVGMEEKEAKETRRLLGAAILLHPGLIIVDHIHFQYNGFLFGVLFWSLWAAKNEKFLLCAFLFSSLLNLKHIYMYVAPAYFVFLLRAYVYPPGSTKEVLPAAFERLITLGAFTLAPFGISLLPLIFSGFAHEAGPFGVLSQMLSRLFPFSRGLNHAYWAPNFWALWTAADRVLLQVLRRAPSTVQLLPKSFQENFAKASAQGFASASRGLIGNVEFAVLPNISPRTCFVITLAGMLVPMAKLWAAPTYKSFVIAISLCGYASFLFGWHVHEKAILMVLLPLTYTAVDDYLHFRSFTILSVAGCFSLFPLLFQPAETPIKVIYTALWLILVLGSLSRKVFRPVPSNLALLTHALEGVYLFGFPLILAYTSIIHPLLSSSPAASASATETGPQSAVIATSATAPTAEASIEGLVSDVAEGVWSAGSSQIAALVSSAASAAAPVASAVGVEVNSSAATSAGSLDFLPLMLTSVYCAIGVCWVGLKLAFLYLRRDFSPEGPRITKKNQ